MPIISTNKINVHRGVKSRAALVGSTVGKLFDLYAEIGLELELEKLSKDEIKEVKNFIETNIIKYLKVKSFPLG